MGLHGHLPENEMSYADHHQGSLLHFYPFLPHGVCLVPMPTWAKCTQIKIKGTTLMNNCYFPV